jgi:phosphate:Na+ symporter
MSISVTLLTILSGICLMLWGLRTIKRAVLRGYGSQVQRAISIGTRNRFKAFFSGLIATLFLQSSTATALLASSFVGRGLMGTAAGLAVMIGADMGTALVTQILSFKVGWVGSLLLCIGIIMHLIYDDGSHRRFLARIIIGLGFILTALIIIRDAAAPLATSETLPLILQPLQNEPILAIAIAAVLTYLMHSSLSAILLFATLAGSGVLPLDLALMFVVGANVGIAIVPLIAVMRDTPKAVQIPLGNMIMRMITAVLFLIFLPIILSFVESVDLAKDQLLILSHIGFNLTIALLFMPFVGTLAKVCERISPNLESEKDLQMKPRYLDDKLLSSPSAAMTCATRETLHMAEILQDMLDKTLDAVVKHDDKDIQDIVEKDHVLDNLFAAVKDYLIRLTREELSDNEAAQAMRIMNFATNLEHSGDVIESSLMDIAQKNSKRKDRFSEEGLKELTSIHKKVCKNLALAQSIFLSSDPELAKQLVGYKKGLREAENKSATNHIKRLQQGLPATVATSGIHMDVIRDLRRINTYVTSVAYGVLND